MRLKYHELIFSDPDEEPILDSVEELTELYSYIGIATTALAEDDPTWRHLVFYRLKEIT